MRRWQAPTGARRRSLWPLDGQYWLVSNDLGLAAQPYSLFCLEAVLAVRRLDTDSRIAAGFVSPLLRLCFTSIAVYALGPPSPQPEARADFSSMYILPLFILYRHIRQPDALRRFAFSRCMPSMT